MFKKVFSFLFLILNAFLWSGNKYPYVILSNGKLDVKIYLPDEKNGYYRGCRFDWSGIVGKVKFGKHTFFGEWLNPYNPEDPNGGIGTVEEFGMGISGMPVPLGFLEAGQGEGFIKIGVGILKKEGKNYFFGRKYKFLKKGKWKIRRSYNSIEFLQKLHYGKYGYVYRKRIILDEEKPQFKIWHKLKNTGILPIYTTVYCHNFIGIDNIPIGPDYTVIFNFPVRAKRSLRGIAKIEKNKIIFLKSMIGKKALFTELEGYKRRVKENHFIIFNKKTGAGMEVRGTLPLYKFNFFAVSTIISPEPFVKIDLKPGQEISWENIYRFFKND